MFEQNVSDILFVAIVVVAAPEIVFAPCAATVMKFVPAFPPASTIEMHVPPATDAMVGKVTVPAVEVAIQKTSDEVALKVVDVEMFWFPVAKEPETDKVDDGAVVPMPTLPFC